jgi:hypothetical protein
MTREASCISFSERAFTRLGARVRGNQCWKRAIIKNAPSLSGSGPPHFFQNEWNAVRSEEGQS